METSEKFGQFFSEVTTGKTGKSEKPYVPYLQIDARAQAALDIMSRFRGNFDDHIAKSIPGHKEMQAITAVAVSDLAKGRGAFSVLDIGGSEGGWVNLLALANENVIATNVDPNREMIDWARKFQSDNAMHVLAPWQYPYDDMEPFFPPVKYNVIHESMVFQFISPDREDQFSYIAQHLADDGIFVCEQKCSAGDHLLSWQAREQGKNEVKSKYFSGEELSAKAEEVLVGMHENMVPIEQLLKVAKANWEHAYIYWRSFNFWGIVCGNDSATVRKFYRCVQDLNRGH